MILKESEEFSNYQDWDDTKTTLENKIQKIDLESVEIKLADKVTLSKESEYNPYNYTTSHKESLTTKSSSKRNASSDQFPINFMTQVEDEYDNDDMIKIITQLFSDFDEAKKDLEDALDCPENIFIPEQIKCSNESEAKTQIQNYLNTLEWSKAFFKIHKQKIQKNEEGEGHKTSIILKVSNNYRYLYYISKLLDLPDHRESYYEEKRKEFNPIDPKTQYLLLNENWIDIDAEYLLNQRSAKHLFQLADSQSRELCIWNCYLLEDNIIDSFKDSEITFQYIANNFRWFLPNGIQIFKPVDLALVEVCLPMVREKMVISGATVSSKKIIYILKNSIKAEEETIHFKILSFYDWDILCSPYSNENNETLSSKSNLLIDILVILNCRLLSSDGTREASDKEVDKFFTDLISTLRFINSSKLVCKKTKNICDEYLTSKLQELDIDDIEIETDWPT